MCHKVAFLAPVAFFKGGAEQSLFDLMANPAITPFLYVPEDGPLAEAARERNIPTRVIPFGNVGLIRRPIRPRSLFTASIDWFQAARLLMRQTREDDVSIVHSNGLKAHAIAGLSRKLGGAPCIFHIRDIALSWLEKQIWRGLAATSSHTILVSRACWAGKELPKNVSVIFNSIDLTKTSLRYRATQRDKIVVGICGRIHPFKGHHLAISWIHAARRDGLNIHLTVRGEADPDDHNYLTQLRAQIKALDIADFVVFEGRKEGLEAVYSGLDAVLVPSQTPDPLPRSVMEAMGVGLPVIGYPSGGIVEMIDHGRSGWFARSAEDFQMAITEIVALGQQYTGFRENTEKAIRERFSREKMFNKINAVYAGILSNKKYKK